MKAEYDFSQAQPNSYAKKLHAVDDDTIDCFKTQERMTGAPDQAGLTDLFSVLGAWDDPRTNDEIIADIRKSQTKLS